MQFIKELTIKTALLVAFIFFHLIALKAFTQHTESIRVPHGQTNISEPNRIIPSQKEPEVEVFPNPTSGTVYIEVGHPVNKNHISVEDNTGHIIIEKDFDGSSSELELTGQSAGMYKLKIENEEGSEIHYVILN